MADDGRLGNDRLDGLGTPPCSSASRNCAALSYRSCARLAKARSTIASNGSSDGSCFATDGGVGVLWQTWYMALSGGPPNGAVPASSSYRTTPAEKTSIRQSNCTQVPLRRNIARGTHNRTYLRLVGVSTQAIPKSATLIRPLFMMMMLEGLMSRCKRRRHARIAARRATGTVC